MRSLGALSRRGLRNRKGRYALTASGTALGVAVLFGVLVAGNAMTSALDRLIEEGTGDFDVTTRAVGSFDSVFPPDVEAELAALPDVERTVGSTGFRTNIVPEGLDLDALADRSGTMVDGGDFLFVQGTNLDALAEVVGLPLAEGRVPEPGADEVVVNRLTQRRHDVEVGDEVQLATATGLQTVTVVGALSEAGAGLSEGSVAYTSRGVAAALLGRGDVLTGIDLVLADGVDAETWIDEHRGATTVDLLMTPTSELGTGFRSFIAGVNAALTSVSAIALFVGGFLVFLTFSLAVTERTRDHGTLRALGAQPRQVRRLVVTEAVILGAFCSVAGLVLGYGIAIVVVSASESLFGFEAGGLGVPVPEAVISVVVALAVCAVAAWVPARRAAALSPVVAMRQGAVESPDRTGRPVLAAILIALGTAIGWGADNAGIQGLSVLVVLLGAVLAVPPILRPLARFIGAVTRRLAPGVGGISVMHLVKERSRSAYTLALVMVVLAMILAVGGTNSGMNRTLDEVVLRQAGSGLQVFAPGAFDPVVEDELRSVPGVTTLAPIRLGNTEVVVGDDDEAGHPVFLAVVDPETYFEVASLPWLEGDDASAREALAEGSTLMLPGPVVDRLGLDVGGTVQVRTTQGLRDFEVGGTFAFMQGFGAMAGVADAELFGAGRPNGYLVGLEPGVEPDDARLAVLERIGPTHDPTVSTAQQSLDDARAQLQGFFGLGYAMLGIAAIVGVLGLANTLVVSVLTRSREIGMLRSVGARRRQVGAMVLVEAATLVLTALVLAIPLAWLLTAGIIDAQRGALGFTIDFVYPWGLLVPLGLFTLLLGSFAALLPARRAGRLEIVEVLRFD